MQRHPHAQIADAAKSAARNARCASSAASMASRDRVNTAQNSSPTVLNT